MRSRLADGSLPRRSFAVWPGFPLSPRAVAWAAAVVLLLAIGLLALFPDARKAVADGLGLRGVRIFFVQEAPTVEPSPVGTRMALGRRVTLAEAQQEVVNPIRVPGHPPFDDPDEVYLSHRAGSGMVSFVYRPGPGLPESPYTGVGALLTQFPGATERGLIEKGLFAKGVSPATRLEFATVNGGPGYWIEGAPHAFFMACDQAGDCQEEWYRLAGNVLLWEENGLTFRLE